MSFLTVRQAATRLQVTEKRILALIHQGHIRALVVGGTKTGYRISEAELERFIEDRTGKTLAAAS